LIGEFAGVMPVSDMVAAKVHDRFAKNGRQRT
jgi:hypothetical protein